MTTELKGAWMDLIKEAQKIGLTPSEVRNGIIEMKKSRTRVMTAKVLEEINLICWKCEVVTGHNVELLLTEKSEVICYHVCCNKCNTYEEWLEKPELKDFKREGRLK